MKGGIRIIIQKQTVNKVQNIHLFGTLNANQNGNHKKYLTIETSERNPLKIKTKYFSTKLIEIAV